MEENNGTVVVTGGAGYLGSHTIIELLGSTDLNVVSIDNFINSSSVTFDRINEITGTHVENFNVDLCDKESVFRAFSRIKNIVGIIHFAALKSVPESVENPLLYYDNNLKSLTNILGVSEHCKVKSLIFSSSCSVYGDLDSFPVSEESPLGVPKSPYAHTKKIGEEILEQFSLRSKMKCISLRYFNPAGAHKSGLIGESPINPPTTLIPVVMSNLAGKNKCVTVFGGDLNTRDGSCVRDYIHVTDIADAHIKALVWSLSHQKNYEVFNLGSEKGVTVLEAISAAEIETGKKVNYQVGEHRKGDVEAIYSNCKKANTILNWEAKNNIQDIVSSAWKWQLNLSGND